MYQQGYDGTMLMRLHDHEQNALRRWFDNYKVDRNAYFATEYEWLVVETVASRSRRGGLRYECEIGDDGRGTSRRVIMDHTAPPAPLITFAAKRRWQPPPPKTIGDLMREREWQRHRAEELEAYDRRLPVYGAFDLAARPDFSAEYRFRFERVFDRKFLGSPPPAPTRNTRNQ